MKILKTSIIMACCSFFMLLCLSCGGGGSSETPTDLPSDTGGEETMTTDELVAKSSQEMAEGAALGVLKAMGVDVALDIAGASSKAIIGMAASGFIRADVICPDGGTLTTVGYNLIAEGRHNVDAALIHAACVAGSSTVDGRFEIHTFIHESGDAVVFDMYLNGSADQDGALPAMANGTGRILSIELIEAEVRVAGASVASTIFRAVYMVDGVRHECTAASGALACTPVDAPAKTALCEDPGLQCVVGAEGDAYCATLVGPVIPPLEDRDIVCLNGCCGYDFGSTCFGLRACAENVDCRYPDFARFCVDGFCQGLCLSDDRCANGATCNPYGILDSDFVSLPPDYGKCTCINDRKPPYCGNAVCETDWRETRESCPEDCDVAICGNGIIEGDEVCDYTGDVFGEGEIGCGANEFCARTYCEACLVICDNDGSCEDRQGETPENCPNDC